jgi:nitrous oxide reductase
MSELSRRKFLHASAAAGAAAVVGLPAVRAVAGSSNHTSDSYSSNGNSHGTPTGSFIVYVNDARQGQVTVLNGDNETVKSDPELVRRIVRAARG